MLEPSSSEEQPLESSSSESPYFEGSSSWIAVMPPSPASPFFM
jgi:hypothetical protein